MSGLLRPRKGRYIASPGGTRREGVRGYLAAAARDAGFDEPDALAERLLILLEGATATAAMRRTAEPLDVARSVALDLMDTRSR